MKKIFLTIVTAAFLGMPCAFAQVVLHHADKHFKNLEYSAAIPKYEKFLNKKPDHFQAMANLADCYRLTGATQQAEKIYAKVITKKEAKPVHHLYFAQALMANGKYDEARAILMVYKSKNAGDSRSDALLEAVAHLENYLNAAANTQVQKLKINSDQSDFGAIPFNGGIVFASSRINKEISQKDHRWTGSPYLSLYFSKKSGNEFEPPLLFDENFETKFHDGPVCFNKTGDEAFITRNNIENGKVRSSADHTVNLKIFFAKRTEGEWNITGSFAYNSDQYSCAHPALSADGTTLYFSSNMPGGTGGMDLYVCTREGNGWSIPRNMGEKVNTPGDEVFPFVHSDGTLYFSSNGLEGIGGLDIFRVVTEQMGGMAIRSKNIGAPYNSPADDFAFSLNSDSRSGYFSSNRLNKGTDDDIYAFRSSLMLKGIAVIKKTGAPVDSAVIDLSDEKGNKNMRITIADGLFEFPVDFERTYKVTGSKGLLDDDTKIISTKDIPPVGEDLFVRLELDDDCVPDFTLTINVKDRDTDLPIDSATIKDEPGGGIHGYSDIIGSYSEMMKPETDLKLMISKPSYSSKIISVSNRGLKKSKEFIYEVALRRGEDISPWEDWFKLLYYDLDKSNIRSDAKKVMDEVVAFMKEHPEVKIGLSSHTDARATDEYNKGLSRRRSESAKSYLLKHGIPAERIVREDAMGESMLVNNCADGTPCSEEDHQLNRRTEIRVVGKVKVQK